MKSNIQFFDVVSRAATQAAVSATLIVALLFAGYMVAEPRISHGQSDTKSFRVRQTITDETSFWVAPSNVTMSSSIAGVTGGNATGSSRFVVRSNNSTGYYVNIAFFDNAGPYAMYGDKDSDTQLRDYSGDVTGEPSYNFTASTAAQFAYSVMSSTTADNDQSFRNNGSLCNQSNVTQTFGKCWKAPSTTPFKIISRTSAAASGATSTIYFKVNVPSNPVPIPTAQTYTATATLTLFIQ
jgi:hypothetical protein